MGKLKYTKEKFIKNAIRKHGDKFDYSKVEYTDSKTKVILICKIHGDFLQKPNSHLNGRGCPICFGKNKPIEEFIDKAKSAHGNRYDYSKSEYIDSKTKICIICNEHGEFLQTARHHTGGSGCPRCKISKGEDVIRNILKNNNIFFEEQKRFSECKNIRQLPFDFYLPSLNTIIEYDGRQHFKPHSWSKDKSKTTKLNNLEFVKAKDEIKNKFCENNGIKLIRINYMDFLKIDNILKGLLSG